MYRFVAIIFLMVLAGCQSEKKKPEFTSDDISRVITNMTEIMVHDITNPPLAARFYAYACLAGYEVISQHNKDIPGLHGILNEYPDIKRNDSLKGYSYQLSALLAMMHTASKMQPNGPRFAEFEKRWLDSLRNAGVDEALIAASKQNAVAVASRILAYAKADGYNKISNYPRYTSLKGEGYWYPTPPAFLAAVEPYFNTVRPFILDSAAMFKPNLPIPFSSDKKSDFYGMMMQVYRDTLTQEKRAIAGFWDCNPFAVQDKGHLMMALKKISPGAHWMGITGIACQQAKKGFDKSMQIYTTVAVGLTDGFICCWDEKFRSNRIRPETAIRKYIDPTWEPLLQTPPFPEYLSGHSVVSATSAAILTNFFGPRFSYTDSVEVSYGLSPRSFKSFNEAAEEAAVSRLYGGIHFSDAIMMGLIQGGRTGQLVYAKMLKELGKPVAQQKPVEKQLSGN
jgi:hypothetical protein